MMSEPTVVDARLDKIEQDNRRLKLTVGALLLVMAAVPLIGAVMPEQIPKVIQAQQFQAVNENGNIRAVMTGGGIVYSDENGNLRAWMDDRGFRYEDLNGTLRAAIYAEGITYWDENGTARVDISDYAITYHDENNILRAVMRANAIRSHTSCFGIQGRTCICRAAPRRASTPWWLRSV